MKESIKKYTFTNNFHDTQVTVIPKRGYLYERQIKRMQKELCGVAGCSCSGDTGIRGPQDWDVEITEDGNGYVFHTRYGLPVG